MVTDFHTQLDLVRDYVNTLDFETGIDRLSSPHELGLWFSEQGLVDDLVEPGEQELAEAVAVREAIRELLLANNGIAAETEAASKTLEEAGRRARLGVRFESGRPVLAPEDDGARGAIGRLVATVAELAPSDEWKRLKTCRDESCRVAFYDKSRNRSRAWCSMEVCGNRDKQRGYRERHAAGTS
jgi:predicted RNA-binding Zn ribbon-like protein